jgi:hypothetical protein
MLNVKLVIVLLHNFSSNNNCHVSFSLLLIGEGKDTQKQGDGSKQVNKNQQKKNKGGPCN